MRVRPPRMPGDHRRVRRRPAGQRLRRGHGLLPARGERRIPPSPRRRRVRRSRRARFVRRTGRGVARARGACTRSPVSRLCAAARGGPRERSRAALLPSRRSAAPRALAEADARVRLASVGRRHPAPHERPGGAHRRARDRAVPRAGRGRHGEALLAASGRSVRRVFPAAVRSCKARRNAEGHPRVAPALPPCPSAAARHPRPACSGGAALRLHAARLLRYLPAISSRHKASKSPLPR